MSACHDTGRLWHLVVWEHIFYLRTISKEYVNLILWYFVMFLRSQSIGRMNTYQSFSCSNSCIYYKICDGSFVFSSFHIFISLEDYSSWSERKISQQTCDLMFDHASIGFQHQKKKTVEKLIKHYRAFFTVLFKFGL